MKVYVYPADIHGCGYLRLIWPARALAAQGHDVVVVLPVEKGQRTPLGMVSNGNGLQGRIDANGNTVAVSAPADADVMVMQRITHKALAQGIPLWRNRGIAVVIDMDDDLSTIHPANPAWRALHPQLGKQGFDWNVAKDACDAATLVTVSTPALASRYARHGRSQVLYNCVPQSFLGTPHADSAVIGWGGAVGSHPDDLQQVGASIARLTDNGGSFRVVGPPGGVESALGVRQNWSASGPVDIHQWPRQLSQDIGVGIAPLADTIFNAAKSWLKPLEYAALGIPVVMSPRVEYQRLHRLGVGMLAAKPRDWERGLKALAASPQLRGELSGRGREVAQAWTIEENAWRWAEAWSRALEIQRGALAHSS